MKLTTYIVEDLERDYKKTLGAISPFEFLEPIGKYEGDFPFVKSIEFIRASKPDILFIDYELNEGSQKTGLELLKIVNTYPCFAIFCSRNVYDAAEAQSHFDNAKFIIKGIEPYFNIETLTKALDVAKNYFINREEVGLKYYVYNKEFSEWDIFEEKFLCKDIVYIVGKGKEFDLYHNKEGVVIKKSGPAGDSGVRKIINRLLDSKYPNYIVASQNPLILYNLNYFTKSRNSGSLVLKEGFACETDLEV